MHKLMVEKGFLRMPLEEIIAMKDPVSQSTRAG
jgi:hypothetical protein